MNSKDNVREMRAAISKTRRRNGRRLKRMLYHPPRNEAAIREARALKAA